MGINIDMQDICGYITNLVLRSIHTKRTRKWKKIKEVAEDIKEKKSNMKENFRFRFHFCSAWMDL